jgi:diadenosine tetraphosphate (Ap4A) HIT family hydrolase
MIDERLINDSLAITSLTLCELRLMNDANYPWLMLIPRVENAREIIDLSEKNQLILMKEIAHVSRVLQKLTACHKLNVAALGNMVPQLHVHIIARFTTDMAWAAPVFGKFPSIPYQDDVFLTQLKEAFA